MLTLVPCRNPHIISPVSDCRKYQVRS